MNQQEAREILRVNKNDSFDIVRKRYHELIKMYHPDRNPSDLKSAENCRRTIEAYNFLCKVKKQIKTLRELEMERTLWEFFKEFWPIPKEFELPQNIKKADSSLLAYEEPYEEFAIKRGFYEFVRP